MNAPEPSNAIPRTRTQNWKRFGNRNRWKLRKTGLEPETSKKMAVLSHGNLDMEPYKANSTRVCQDVIPCEPTRYIIIQDWYFRQRTTQQPGFCATCWQLSWNRFWKLFRVTSLFRIWLIGGEISWLPFLSKKILQNDW